MKKGPAKARFERSKLARLVRPGHMEGGTDPEMLLIFRTRAVRRESSPSSLNRVPVRDARPRPRYSSAVMR